MVVFSCTTIPRALPWANGFWPFGPHHNAFSNKNPKNMKPPRVGRVGHGQKPEQRLPKSRTKWVETQGGARSVTERLPSEKKALPALSLPT